MTVYIFYTALHASLQWTSRKGNSMWRQLYIWEEMKDNWPHNREPSAWCFWACLWSRVTLTAPVLLESLCQTTLLSSLPANTHTHTKVTEIKGVNWFWYNSVYLISFLFIPFIYNSVFAASYGHHIVINDTWLLWENNFPLGLNMIASKLANPDPPSLHRQSTGVGTSANDAGSVMSLSSLQILLHNSRDTCSTSLSPSFSLSCSATTNRIADKEPRRTPITACSFYRDYQDFIEWFSLSSIQLSIHFLLSN